MEGLDYILFILLDVDIWQVLRNLKFLLSKNRDKDAIEMIKNCASWLNKTSKKYLGRDAVEEFL